MKTKTCKSCSPQYSEASFSLIEGAGLRAVGDGADGGQQWGGGQRREGGLWLHGALPA